MIIIKDYMVGSHDRGESVYGLIREKKDELVWDMLYADMQKGRQKLVEYREALEKRLRHLNGKIALWIIAYLSFYSVLLLSFAAAMSAGEKYGIGVLLAIIVSTLTILLLTLFVYFWKVDLLKRERNSTIESLQEVNAILKLNLEGKNHE